MNEFRAVIRGMGAPLYLLDGVPISENSLSMINQFDINRIEILKGPGTTGIYGGRGSGGVIAFFSEMGTMEEIDPEGGKHIIVHQAAGFNRIRQFYSPKYETTEYYELPDSEKYSLLESHSFA
jgi:outer membrane cobalamin receptor